MLRQLLPMPMPTKHAVLDKVGLQKTDDADMTDNYDDEAVDVVVVVAS